MTYMIDDETITVSNDRGLVVVLTTPDITSLMAATRLANSVEHNPDDMLSLLDIMGRHLVSWNAADRNGPIPGDAAGLGRLRLDDLAPILRGWIDNSSGVVAPDLKADSTSGEPSALVPPIPMEAL